MGGATLLLFTTTPPPRTLLYSQRCRHDRPSWASSSSSSINISSRRRSSLLLPYSRPKRRPSITTQSNRGGGGDSADALDRLISAVCYLYPFFDGVQYGKYIIIQFSPLQTLLQPLVPSIRVFKSFPLNGFLVFLTLYFAVVRNPNFSRYVRFNTMQAIALDVLLIFPDLLERTFFLNNPSTSMGEAQGLGLQFLTTFDTTVFLFLLVSLLYASSSCLLGLVPRLPIVAEAADRQVP